MNDHNDVLIGHWVVKGNAMGRFSVKKSCADFAYLDGSQARISVLFAAWTALWLCACTTLRAARKMLWFNTRPVLIPRWITAFLDAICSVVQCCAKKQVIGANTRWGIAVVADKHVIRWRGIRQGICNAVGKKGMPIDLQSSIAALCSASRPQPTAIGFINLYPKPGDNIRGKMVGHDLNLLYRFGECRATGVTAPRGFVMPHYST